MKNIFKFHKHTNLVILKSAVVTSILKNLSIKKVKKSSTDVLRFLSSRALRGNLFTSIHSFQSSFSIFDFKLSTINYKLSTSSLAHGMLALLFFSVMLIQSGCSLTADRYIERYLGNNSICWEDNDHILIYASIAQYWYNQNLIGGESKEYDWTGGEIWRITASTGAKELLFRSKESTYSNLNAEEMRLLFSNSIYIGDGTNTYKVKDDYSEWDSISYISVQSIDKDERTFVGVYELGGKSVVEYNLIDNTEEVLYVNDYMITWLDYDFERNYLLINSNKFVDLNTGEEFELASFRIESIYEINPYYIFNGKINDDYITVDFSSIYDHSGDTIINSYGKIFVKITNLNESFLSFVVHGVLSPDGSKYVTLGTFTDTLGNMISEWNLPSTEL